MSSTNFRDRHNGPRQEEVSHMLQTIGVNSIDQLINETVPAHIRLKAPLNVSSAMSEDEYLSHAWSLGKMNVVAKNYIGLGYHPTLTPTVILRNIFENPGWYTAYTPYQAEIAQGRLEAILNFQTMITDLTSLPIANGSLLDEGTAGAEAMILFFHSRSRAKEQAGANKYFVDAKTFPQTIDVLKGRAFHLGIELVIGDYKTHVFTSEFFGACVQFPNAEGSVEDYSLFCEGAHANDVYVSVASDLMALATLTPPGEWGADLCFGNSQRFGVPMGFGGPHAAFFATKEDFKRNMPGRIIGVSKDRHGNTAYRMALQTREQHIRREKATSNICTAQALLAVMASMYGVYHGPKGVKSIATRIHTYTHSLRNALVSAGMNVVNTSFYDTLTIASTDAGIQERAASHNVNMYFHEGGVSLSLNEGTKPADLNELFFILTGKEGSVSLTTECSFGSMARTSDYMTHPHFNSHHSETEMLRYMKKLENKDLSLAHAMIPLGSCTMKLNATSEMMPLSWPEFNSIHPFAPANQTTGYQKMLVELEKDLCECTGFAGVSLQPNSGAQGELSGLLVIMAYHRSRGEGHRNICLIPSSAHGTNAASAVMAGMKVVVIDCDDNGNVSIDDIKAKIAEHGSALAALMITYPSTHGVFETAVSEICGLIHEAGGQVYVDGANLNALVGVAQPGKFGADVSHLNLHKTFAIPHGGGGPGVGPVIARAHLAPFLPNHPFDPEAGPATGPGPISGAPFGSASILPISWAYIRLLGGEGLTHSTQVAILSANYMATRLQDSYPVLYTGANGRVAHECILDIRGLTKDSGVSVDDIAKRLMDYGFHAPTMSFPVAGTLMIEPTESEDIREIHRFINAMISIRAEIQEVIDGKITIEASPLRNAPHTALSVVNSQWDRSYSREQGGFPVVLDGLVAGESIGSKMKYWPPVGRIDGAHGDRNLVCACTPMDDYR